MIKKKKEKRVCFEVINEFGNVADIEEEEPNVPKIQLAMWVCTSFSFLMKLYFSVILGLSGFNSCEF